GLDEADQVLEAVHARSRRLVAETWPSQIDLLPASWQALAHGPPAVGIGACSGQEEKLRVHGDVLGERKRKSPPRRAGWRSVWITGGLPTWAISPGRSPRTPRRTPFGVGVGRA